MRFRHSHQGRAQCRRLAGIDRNAGAAVAEVQRMHVVDAPFAPDDDRQPGRKGGFFVQGAVHFMAAAPVEHFEIPAHPTPPSPAPPPPPLPAPLLPPTPFPPLRPTPP